MTAIVIAMLVAQIAQHPQIAAFLQKAIEVLQNHVR